MLDLLTVEQVSQSLGIRPKTVHELVRQGKLSCVQVTPRLRKFTQDQIDEFIRCRTITVPNPIDKKSFQALPCARKGGEKKKSTRVSEAGLLREEIKRLCQ